MSTQPTTSNAIESRPNQRGQVRSFISGTRVRVIDLYAMVEIQGQTPDQVVDAFPHLTLAQVHAGLSYYFANREEVVRQFREEESLGEFHRRMTGPGPLELKLSGKDPQSGSVSS